MLSKKKGVEARDLTTRWNIPLELAKKTIQVTTQFCLQSTEALTLNRRFKTNDRILRYSRVIANVFMDTFFASNKLGASKRGNKVCQIFVTEFSRVHAVPLASKSGENIAFSLKKYFKNVGVPPMIICDATREQIQGDSLLLCNNAGCQIYNLEKGTPNSNRAERSIQMLKNETKSAMIKANSPIVFWDYCVKRRARIINLVARHHVIFQRWLISPGVDG
jgi:hypothetical protein